MIEPRIYIADLAAYNAGILHGIWIDACQDIEDIQKQVRELLENSPVEDSEEYAIHDFEGFGSVRLSEYQGIYSAHEIACFIEQHGELGAELLNYFHENMEEALTALEDHYAGCHTSLEDFVQELTEETTDIPENISFYIDYSRMAYDMEVSGDIYTIETGAREVHIFWNR